MSPPNATNERVVVVAAQKKLHNACALGDRALLEEAVRDGADVSSSIVFSVVGEEEDFEDDDVNAGRGRASLLPLHLAARNNHAKICEDLISRFAVEVDQEDERGRTALFHAIAMDRAEVVKVLVERFRADANHADGTEETPTSMCAKVGSLECLEALLSSSSSRSSGGGNADDATTSTREVPDVCTARGQFRLPPMVECACARTDWQTFPKVAERLRREVAKQRFNGRVEDVDVEYFEIQVNEKTKKRRSLLMLAVGLGNAHAVRFLCDEWKVDIHRASEEGEDGESFGPLELARAGKFKECEEELLKRGAKEKGKKKTKEKNGKVKVASEAAEGEGSLKEKKARLQSLAKERERLSFIVQANEDEVFQSSMREPRIKAAVEDVMENFMSVKKYAEDKDVMAALSKWRGCQRFFKQRGEKVSFEEIVVNLDKGGEEAVRKRKLRIEHLGETIAKELMEVASSLPKNGNTQSIDKNNKYSPDDDDDESVKREKNSKMFYLRVIIAIIQLLPLVYVLYLRLFRSKDLKFTFEKAKKTSSSGSSMAFDASASEL
jgi:ankyrin repeat protein